MGKVTSRSFGKSPDRSMVRYVSFHFIGKVSGHFMRRSVKINTIAVGLNIARRPSHPASSFHFKRQQIVKNITCFAKWRISFYGNTA